MTNNTIDFYRNSSETGINYKIMIGFEVIINNREPVIITSNDVAYVIMNCNYSSGDNIHIGGIDTLSSLVWVDENLKIGDKVVIKVVETSKVSPAMKKNCDKDELRIKYESEKIAALEAEFEKYVVCPSEEEIAEVWKPFSDHMDVSKAWIMYHNSQQRKVMQFSTVEIEPPQIVKKYSEYGKPICVYQGIVAGDMAGAYSFNQNGFCIFLMERTWKPTVDISRTKVSGLPSSASGVKNEII